MPKGVYANHGHFKLKTYSVREFLSFKMTPYSLKLTKTIITCLLKWKYHWKFFLFSLFFAAHFHLFLVKENMLQSSPFRCAASQNVVCLITYRPMYRPYTCSGHQPPACKILSHSSWIHHTQYERHNHIHSHIPCMYKR